MITEKLDGQGLWTVALKEDAPESLVDVLQFAGHIVITTERVDYEAMADVDLRNGARYMGVLTHRPIQNEFITIKGKGLIWWLGDQGRGKVYRGASALEFTNKTFDDGWTDILATPTPITKGSIEATAGTYTHTFDYVTQRQAAERFAAAFGAEFRINHDFTLDAGASGFLYNGTPSAVIARKFAGDDPEVDGLEATLIDGMEDIETFITTAVVAAEGTGDSLQTGEQSLVDKLFKDPQGNDIDRTQVFNDPASASGEASDRAQQHLDAFGAVRKTVKLSLADFHVKGEFEVGDLIHVWDPIQNLRDTTNELHFRGQALNPIAIRVIGMNWPILRGMGVYYRDEDGNYTDLTDYVAFDSGEVTVEVGASSRNLVEGSSEALDARITIDPDGNDTLGPAQPTHKATPWSTFQDVSSQGVASSRIVVEWNTPNNTDSSTVTDGLGFNVRYRKQGETDYSTQFVNWGLEAAVIEGLTPGVVYEVNVEAGDVNGNWSGYATVADEVVTAATDGAAPSQPSAPTMAANALNAQVTHDLQKQATGDLEADLDHLNVYIDTVTPLVPSASNKVGEIKANQAMINLGLSVIATFSVQDATQRYVVVTAVDRDGNESPASPEATVTADLIDTQHITDLAVTNAKIGDLSATKITAGTITAHNIRLEGTGESGSDGIVIITSGTTAAIESDNYSAGSAGFHAGSDGNAEFNDITARGTIYASAGELGGLDINGNLTFTSGGVFRTATSGKRIEIATASADRISFYSGHASETAAGYVEVLSNSFTIAAPKITGVMNESGKITWDSTGMSFFSNQGSPLFIFESDALSGNTIVRIDGSTGWDATLEFNNSGTYIESDIGIGGGNLRYEADGGATYPHSFTVDTTQSFVIDSNVAKIADGSAAAPGLSFISETNKGIYDEAANVIGFSAGGNRRFSVGSTAHAIGDGTTTGTGRLYAAGAGVVSNPTYGFVGDSNTGMYRDGAGVIAFAASGVRELYVGANVVAGGSLTTGTWRLQDEGVGSPSHPEYSFQGDPDTGIYRSAANEIAFATAGIGRFIIDTSAFYTGANSGSASNTTSRTMQTADYMWATRSGGSSLFLQRTSSDGSVASFIRQTTVVGTISVTASATAYNESSDIRLKDNLIDYKGGLEVIRLLKVREWDWNMADVPDAQRHDVGLVAQEVAEVVPRVVTIPEDDGTWQMHYGRLTPWLVSALQELDEKVSALEAA